MLLLLLLACKTPTVVPTDPPPPPAPPELAINEVMSDNNSTLQDPANPVCAEFDDWVEIINPTEALIDLAGVQLEDDGGSLSLPSLILEPGEPLLIWTDGDPDQGVLHAEFRVSKAGESIRLVSRGTVLDEVWVPALGPDESYARSPDGIGEFRVTDRATPGTVNQRAVPDDPCLEVDGFDDHAYPCITDADSYRWLSGSRPGLAVVKFEIFDFQDPSLRRIVFTDSNFYTLHDQFYLFTVLNGQTFGSLTDYPTFNGSFSTWKELNDWAASVDLGSLFDPRQVRYAGERLYSSYFYQNINGTPRDLGVGTLVHRPKTPNQDVFWGFELEAGDTIDAHDLGIYFEQLEAAGPPEFADLKWLIRSAEQEQLAQALEAAGDPLASRLMRYTELSEPGAIEVYNTGLTAGRVHMVRAGEPGLEASRDDYILVVDEIPDYLPPARALITNVPQTPLSHVALLARSRNIPNIHLAGVTSDAQWDAWQRVHARIALEVDGPSLQVVGLDTETYSTWLGLLDTPAPVIPVVDASQLPYAVPLDGIADVLALRRTTGGKVAGMAQLIQTAGIDTPNTPIGLTIRGYQEHLAALPTPNGAVQTGWLQSVLQDDPFIRRFDTALRFAVVEGERAYDLRYPSSSDQTRLAGFLDARPPGHLTGDLVRGGGLRGLVEATPLPVPVQQAIRSAIEARFSSLPDGGFRFRSSSTVEDIEGFNGAGLYNSYTGYLDPQNGRPLEDAVRKVYASYWGYEAVEERQAAGIEHLAGGMGVLVHPRFTDAFERANMVLALTRTAPDNHTLIINAQIGSTSVANPPNVCPPVLPEVISILQDGSIQRLSNSTETPDPVLSDAEVLALYAQSIDVAEGWLALENAALPPERQRKTVTLDLEARSMLPGWFGSTEERLVIKQSRSLDPSTGNLPENLRTLPVPEDVLARASIIQRSTCSGSDLVATIDSVFTDPLEPPDLGYSEMPFVFQVALEVLVDQPELGWDAGAFISWGHLELFNGSYVNDSLTADRSDGMVYLSPISWSISNAHGQASGTGLECTTDIIWASPDLFLLEQLESPSP